MCGDAAAQTYMQGIEPFLMEGSEEIRLARSAAPRGIGADAEIWVLAENGYVRAEEGSNGFACFVGRGWSGPVVLPRPDGTRAVSPDALDPRIRAPHCFNPIAAGSVLPWHRVMTEALIAGVPFEELHLRVAEALEKGTISPPEAGAFAYMTSPEQNLGERFGNWRPHLMLYVPFTEDHAWGADGFSSDFPFVVEDGTTWSVAIVPIGTFSDGSHPDY